MKISTNVPLAQYTTFRIGGPARYFCSVKNEEELVEAVRFAKENKEKIFILGEGSNVLISDVGFFGLVIKMELKGLDIEEEKDNYVRVNVAAGELWDSFVEKMVEKGLYGVENLSAIPGTVGAAPVQNIGAYGMDVSESVESVRVFDMKEMKFRDISNAQCKFSYRHSVFKLEKENYVITNVRFKLKKNGKVNISYSDLQKYFENRKDLPSLEDVRKAVIEIRWKKLPDWKLWGNAGSFFKNPVISEPHYNELKKKYPAMPGYKEPNGLVKVSLGWILDKVCNMKGFDMGNVSTHVSQALVIVAKPGAKSEEVVKLAYQLINTVKEKTGIEVEGEVEWVN